VSIKESCILKAISYLNEQPSVRSSTAKFFKYTSVNDIVLKEAASPKYPGQGKSTLVNGVRGSVNFLDGQWLGFEESDLETTIDLGTTRKINKVIIGCLNSPDSWIFLPKGMTVLVSKDGKIFKSVEKPNIGWTEDENIAQGIHDLDLGFQTTKARFVKILVKNIGRCPDGHPGAGGKAWLFVDEIIIE
jgi:hexosaminidase